MTLVSVNVYAERLEGNVVVWLVFSQSSGEVFALTLEPDDVPRLIEALQENHEKALDLLEPPPPAEEMRLCSLCGERPGKAIYGWHCAVCFEARRAERDDY